MSDPVDDVLSRARNHPRVTRATLAAMHAVITNAQDAPEGQTVSAARSTMDKLMDPGVVPPASTFAHGPMAASPDPEHGFHLLNRHPLAIVVNRAIRAHLVQHLIETGMSPRNAAGQVEAVRGGLGGILQWILANAPTLYGWARAILALFGIPLPPLPPLPIPPAPPAFVEGNRAADQIDD